MILKTNKTDCYFVCNLTKTQSDKFIESPKLSLYYDHKFIDNIYIDSRTNNIVGKDMNGTTFIIDDGYRNKMIKAGYIVYKNYDTEKILDRDEGNEVHRYLINNIHQYLLREYIGEIIYSADKYINEYYLEKSGYKFTIKLYSNIDIVKKNQERKINGLQFYPFDKKMDNYGTTYITVHAMKITDEESDVKASSIADDILSNIIKNTNETKYVAMDIINPLYFIEKVGD
jgi:hypothetical protein